MTEQQHPITPPPELKAQWRQEAPRYRDGGVTREDWLIDSAAQWGLSQCGRLPVPAYFLGVPLIPPADCIDPQSWIAMRIYQMGCDQRDKDIERKLQKAADKELEACCEWLGARTSVVFPVELRAARRPKPLSLKEQGIKSLDNVIDCLKSLVPGASVDGEDIKVLRRALESIPAHD